MRKTQRGNKEAKKPKQVPAARPMDPLPAIPAVAPRQPPRK